MKPAMKLSAFYVVTLLVTVAALGFTLFVGVPSDAMGDVVRTLRASRAAGALISGAALSVGGALVQGLFRNPLASPSILGTTAGASLGGQVAILCVHVLGITVAPELVLPFGCLLGALLSLGILLALLRRTEDMLTILLTGFLLNSLFLAFGSLLMSMAQEEWQLGRAVVAFALGTLSGVGLPQVYFALPLFIVATIAAFFWARPLDLMLSGEREAKSLGVDVASVRWWTVVWVSVLVAAAVSLSGSLAFVGLVVPHVVRSFAGVSHRRLLPACALAGGAFVLLCDALARALPSQGEVPLGVVSALIGAPTFLVLLVRSQREARS
ncbi:MAG: iron complex transport system permease protein [Polyangiales bacterium]|jgi:iron complex transport system permease protein